MSIANTVDLKIPPQEARYKRGEKSLTRLKIEGDGTREEEKNIKDRQFIDIKTGEKEKQEK